MQDLGSTVGGKDSPFEFSGSCCVLKRVIVSCRVAGRWQQHFEFDLS